MNRLHEMFQIAVNIEEVDHSYFKLISQPSGKVLSVITSDGSLTIGTQDFRNDSSQLWDIIPTGEKDYFRIKTVSRPVGQMDYMFLQVTDQDAAHLTLARRSRSTMAIRLKFVINKLCPINRLAFLYKKD